MMQHARVKITCVGCTRLLLTHTCTSAPHYLMVTAVSSYIIPPVVKEIRLFRLLFTLVRLVPVHLVLMVTDVLRRGCAYHCDPDTIVSFIPDEFHYAHYYFLVWGGVNFSHQLPVTVKRCRDIWRCCHCLVRFERTKNREKTLKVSFVGSLKCEREHLLQRNLHT